MTDIVVVGSLNLDTTARVDHLPAPGETVLGSGHFTDPGGKGANQAVAAARLGRSVAMIGAVGADAAGERLRVSLAQAGVAADAVCTDDARGTGIALITVDGSGENTIVVSPGANAALSSDHIASKASLLSSASITMLQLEIPIDSVVAAARLSGGLVLLNPAPAQWLPADLRDLVDVLIPNQTELGILAGTATPSTREEAAVAAAGLGGSIVVTLGADGALVVQDGAVIHLPAPRVDAVDPTAAGDAFCGGLADALSRGESLVESARWAVRCGAAAATRWGAQASLPTRADVEAIT